MFETLGFETLTPRTASILFGLGLGAAFGVLAELTRFCLRRGVIGSGTDGRQALAVWLTALAVAVIGTQGAVMAGWVEFSGHRYHAPTLPILSLVVGGLMFGAGMVMTRGCLSRLVVLGSSGNLRAVVVIGVAALTAQAALKGVFSPLRTTLGAVEIPAPSLPVLGAVVPVLLAAFFIAQTRPKLGTIVLAALLGGLIPLGWLGTGLVLMDEFDPIAVESLSFTLPLADTLFWTAASSAVGGNFGTGLIGGVVLGAALSALLAGRFAWQGFEGAGQMGRYLSGGVLMGLGGVFAGGCTVGAGLSGVATLSTAATIALLAIIAGAWIAARVDARINAPETSGSGAQTTTPDTPQAA
ncbi:Sulphur transport [Aliiroseovarius halocynthiae]|uniref:YeeE/YedE family protein n=2 Tax=Aliiroseovarius halocynthiae TaxID=985055 RepID=A0A545SX44_9RHOB|nr:YeeE/YedE thiosulfate transporter family protein [Aliiroseovarius halocynthiae]TQV69543.1 YeeE/YedE family protein [Aliiroseovarius halocynthiae]SMR71277.1 Sulphur transport [Aliiroseovarius halocynthiae]